MPGRLFLEVVSRSVSAHSAMLSLPVLYYPTVRNMDNNSMGGSFDTPTQSAIMDFVMSQVDFLHAMTLYNSFFTANHFR